HITIFLLRIRTIMRCILRSYLPRRQHGRPCASLRLKVRKTVRHAPFSESIWVRTGCWPLARRPQHETHPQMLMDALIAILLTAGEAHDCPVAERLINRVKAPKRMLGDRGLRQRRIARGAPVGYDQLHHVVAAGLFSRSG